MQASSYWDKYYEENPYKDGKQPSSFLESNISRLQKGKLLDVGMGEGSNAVYLAMKGFEVKGFDASQIALSRAQKLASDSGVSIQTEQVDLDMYLFGLMEYDTILMTHFRPPVVRYYSEIVRALKMGGIVLVESLMIDELEEAYSKEESFKHFHYGANELLKNLSDLRILFYNEGRVNGKHTVQCIAQKPMDKDAAKYQLFGMNTGKTDSKKSKQMELAEQLFKK